jgi:ribosomal protein L13E
VKYLGKIRKGTTCSVVNCSEEAVRSVNGAKAKNLGLNVDGRRAYICKLHYKEYKKGSKKDRQIEKWRQGVP